MTNQELKTSLRKKWEAIIGNDSQISDVLRGTAVNEFLPFLSNTYLYHRGIDLKNGKLTQETDKLDILFNKFRNRVIGSKRYSRKGSDHHGTPTTYDVLMSDLMKSVIEVIESLDLDNINKETNFEQKYNIFLRNQLHQNENFLQGIKHKFEKATKAQQEELKKACAGIQSELQQVARDMGDEEKHFALAIFGRLDPSFRAEFDILLRRLVFIAKRDQKYYLKMKTIPKDSNGLASQRVRCKALHALLELIDSVEGVESAGQLINYTSISKIFSPGELEELFTKLASLRLEDILSQFRLISKDELDWLEMGDKPPLHAIANQNSSNFPSMKNLHKELVEKLEAIN